MIKIKHSSRAIIRPSEVSPLKLSSSVAELTSIEETPSPTHRLLQRLVITPAPNTKSASPDYTFISKNLRAIVRSTDSNGLAPEDETSHYAFTPEELSRLIEHKKQTRLIDAYVVVGNLTDFLRKLHTDRQLSVGSFPRRIQVAFKRAGADIDGTEFDHWTALDILLRVDCMKIFYLDSAGDPRNLGVVTAAAMQFANTELTLCEDIEIMGKSLALQKDGQSCSIFTIDHVFHMSKLEHLHELIDRYRIKEPGTSEIFSLDPANLPAVLARNAQSAGFIKRWIDMNPDSTEEAVDKKGQSFLDYVGSNLVFYPPIDKNINAGIQRKQIKYAKRLGIS